MKKRIDFDKFDTSQEMEDAIKETFPSEYSALTNLGLSLTSEDAYDCPFMAYDFHDKDRALVFFPGYVDSIMYDWELYLEKNGYLTASEYFSNFDDLIAYVKG